MTSVVQALKAAGEDTRLRILAVLDRHELTVTELVQVLGQSQPRVSRHLKVLSDADLVVRHQEGTSAFYRLDRDGPHAGLLHAVLAETDLDAPAFTGDGERLRAIREARAARAELYFRDVAADWDCMRNRHVPDADIEAALVAAVKAHGVGDLVDLGTGTGRILELLGPLTTSGVGVDLSREMLTIARDKLERAGLRHCHVRHGDIHHLDLPPGAADVAVLHHVLHFLDEPASAVAEAARVLRPGGMLVIIDFAPHLLEQLRADHAHRRLGFADEEVQGWFDDTDLVAAGVDHFVPDRLPGSEALTVTMWTATRSTTRTQDAHATYELEVAS